MLLYLLFSYHMIIDLMIFIIIVIVVSPVLNPINFESKAKSSPNTDRVILFVGFRKMYEHVMCFELCTRLCWCVLLDWNCVSVNLRCESEEAIPTCIEKILEMSCMHVFFFKLICNKNMNVLQEL